MAMNEKLGTYSYIRDAITAVHDARLSWARQNDVYAALGQALAALDTARREAEALIAENKPGRSINCKG